VFAARYELNSYIVFRKRLVSKRLIKHPTMNMYGGTQVQLHSSTSALDECRRSVSPVASRLRIEDFVDTRASLDVFPSNNMEPTFLHRPVSCTSQYRLSDKRGKCTNSETVSAGHNSQNPLDSTQNILLSTTVLKNLVN
jgi:hypothetical protein